MPVFVINTNVKDVPANFKSLATEAVAKTLGKPVSYVAVQVNAGQNLSFGGTDEPAALCDLMSIGALSVESNKKHSKALMELLGKQLSIKPSRIYLSFHNANKADVGYNETTFDDLI
jgi:phenylpyruvate tautomerase